VALTADTVRRELAAILRPREPDAPATVLGAGSDDLDAGRAYLQALAPGGWFVASWPEEYGGRGAGSDEAALIARELAVFDAPDLYPYLVGLALVAPTLLEHGTAEHCRRFLPPLANGHEIWCQLFSEPEAGSDLANLATRAVRDGDVWRVTGSKVWSSRAHYSRWGWLLARTDPAAPKHAGITAFVVDMHAPGVDVRPLRQMNGDIHFNEVFFADAVVADDCRIGDVGGGWRVALTTLAFERGGGSATGISWSLGPDRLLALAREHGATGDAVRRDQLARVWAQAEVARLTARRARAAADAPGPAGSGAKARASATMKTIAGTALAVRGAEALLAGDEWHTLFLTAPSISIRGGTDEIQRNIIGERVLGLPGEPRLDRDVPWRDQFGGR
jgi:alkylation response protein AidB-like acyl-CoA dehydrogenase